MLTAERLRELLTYAPETGLFYWKVAPSNGRTVVGSVAGRVNDEGYRKIGIDGRVYAAHRLAYLYMPGEWPKELIDHENLARDDNRWRNLRPATRTQNKANSLPRSACGFKGVYITKKRGKIRWRAQIRAEGHLHSLGYYGTPEEANAAYAAAADKLFGEFARAA